MAGSKRTCFMVAMMLALAALPARAGGDPGQVLDHFYEAYREGSVEKMLAVYAPEAVFDGREPATHLHRHR